MNTLVHAIAVGEVRLRGISWVLRKEILVGLIIGLVVSSTIATITLWSATVASVLPLILRRVRIDPAVVSTPCITTLVDRTGLVIYVTIAKYVLGR